MDLVRAWRIVKHRVRSSSLIEVTTALVILSMVFGLAIVIYLNVQRSGVSSRKLVCTALLERVYADVKTSGNYETREFTYDEITVYLTAIPHGESPELRVLALEARDAGGKLLAQQKHLLYAPQ